MSPRAQVAEAIRHTLAIHPWGRDLPYPFSEYVERLKLEIADAAIAAYREASGALGFLVQCGICPQRAIVATQPVDGWVCPRCTEVAEPVGTIRSGVVQTETQGAVHHFGPHDIVSQETSDVECVVYCNCGQQFYGSLPSDAHDVHREHRAYQELGEVAAAPADDDEYPVTEVIG